MKGKLAHVKKILAELRRMPEVKAVYLFGSYANGEEKPMSDIDLCAITTRRLPESKKLEILSNAGAFIDISVFQDLPIAVRARVLKEGKLLYCKDKGFLNSVFASTVQEYLDFKPVLEKFTKLYIGG